jgi:hypothetical protein
VRTSLQGQRDTLLGTASQIGALQTMVVDRLAQAETAAARLRQELLSRDAAALWTTLRTGGPAEARSLAWQRTARQLADFCRDAGGRVVAYLVVALLLLVLALTIRGRLPSWPREVQTPAVLTVASRPVSSAVLVTALLAFVPGRNDPLTVSEVAGLVLLVPLWRVLQSRLGDGVTTVLPLLGLLRAISLLRRWCPRSRTRRGCCCSRRTWPRRRGSSGRCAPTGAAERWGRAARRGCCTAGARASRCWPSRSRRTCSATSRWPPSSRAASKGRSSSRS